MVNDDEAAPDAVYEVGHIARVRVIWVSVRLRVRVYHLRRRVGEHRGRRRGVRLRLLRLLRCALSRRIPRLSLRLRLSLRKRERLRALVARRPAVLARDSTSLGRTKPKTGSRNGSGCVNPISPSTPSLLTVSCMSTHVRMRAKHPRRRRALRVLPRERRHRHRALARRPRAARARPRS